MSSQIQEIGQVPRAMSLRVLSMSVLEEAEGSCRAPMDLRTSKAQVSKYSLESKVTAYNDRKLI